MDLINLEDIIALANEPEEKEAFNTWVQQNDIIPFLENEAQDEYVIIYASFPHVFIHAVLIPEVNLEESIVSDLLKWSYNPFSSWGLTVSSDDAWIENPLSSAGSDTLKSGEQILFGRSFEGNTSRSTYFEFNQKIAHVINVHYVPERKAWCKLDRFGDIEDSVKIIELKGLPKNRQGTIISVKKAALGEYAGVKNLSLLRMYDFTRYKAGGFSGWGNNNKQIDFGNTSSIFGKLVVKPGTHSYSRGFQLIDIRVPKEQVIDSFCGGPTAKGTKQYCSFIAQDWKNKKISEISCDPLCLANYVTESDLPFEITPAFFKPEVLLKYKSDRAKYKLASRSVGCRGTWHLETFDINDAGQVHTYLVYLSRLPYEEQLHWKEFNEKPKAPLSKRAIQTDFEGRFYDGYDPLPSLKRKLEELHNTNTKWWTLRDQDSPNKVHYPYTSSQDEWADEILNLDQLLVEGLEEKWLRRKAQQLGCNPEAKLRALKLVEEILVALDFEAEHARQIMSPFHGVHNLRSTLKGHASGSKAENRRKESLKEFGSFRNHFEKLCANCDESMEIIIEAFKKL